MAQLEESRMRITLTLTENEISEIIRQHFALKGCEMYDWQIYQERKEIFADIRITEGSLAIIKHQEDVCDRF
jgi:hypothetical protein